MPHYISILLGIQSKLLDGKNSDMKKGGSGDSFSISNSYTIQAIDTTTAAQLIEQNQESVYQAVLSAANERGGF